MTFRFSGQNIALAVALLMILFIAVEAAFVKFNGTLVSVPVIPRQPQKIGSGVPLSYVVLGDSTAVSQGGDYSQGYAEATARFLAQKYQVTFVNVAVAGARTADVAGSQVAQAQKYKPDFVLIAVGANDVTHLTSVSSVRSSLLSTITQLRQSNKDVKIVLTGSPEMGSVPRLPQPLRWLAGKQTQKINHMVAQVATQQQAVFAPIAQKTGALYKAHPELFAADKFHPTTQGYLPWIPVLETAFNQALNTTQ